MKKNCNEDTLKKINCILNSHRASEVCHKPITQLEFNIVREICWIQYEYKSYMRLKRDKEGKIDYVIQKLEKSVDLLYERYFDFRCMR